MSTVEATKPVDQAVTGSVAPAPAPVLASDNLAAPVEAPKTEDVSKPEGETVVPVEEKKDDKVEEKIVEPIYSGALGYKAPGLKNAFRFAKKYFWFGEEPVPSSNLAQYLRGEKPEVAHPVVAWSSQTGKGLLYFVKHADTKEHPAGVLNLAYATDLHKDGLVAFAFKISGHKHAFEAQTAAERDGWFLAVEKAIAEAKEAKEGIESSEGYKEQKEKIGKPTPLAAASTSAPKKSIDATPKLAEGDAPATEGPVVATPARAGSSSSSSSDGQKKAKKSKSKSRSVSRKRASIFGGLRGKKDKEGEAVKSESEVKKDESAAAPQLGETSTTAPVITQDIPKPSEELKTDATPALAEEAKTEETPAKATEEKPKISKRGSIFGSFVEKLKSPKEEKKEHDFPAPPAPAKDTDAVPEASKPLEEAHVAPPATPVVHETSATEDTKPVATRTPEKEKEHFSFGKLFNKERAKSPAPEVKADVAPRLEDTAVAAPAVVEPVQPVAESKPEVVEEKKEETPKKEKRASFFGSLTRSLSKATTKKDVKTHETKETPATVPEVSEETPVIAENKTETPAPAAPVEQTIGDVPAEAVTVGEPKSALPVATKV
ncbi:uncharacterized protein K460DRAFT_295330 [Cucurbitaria berberidis CBS 394.84]|uniref:Meiotic expression up-regulated protein 6 PH domain-containing protein n=1 Tax=Cucurbitaria berberidis CBS 394.84 TaxID=1168544 RepID=A0A9P4L4L8_9PLEO|nr:uncharacterized protein K460DRAFT_295330 [Cucurbitaria berberidis CBS 394.84]KAF1841013.1 hypothetical protein K460DRAFT_295330 [Cucurbitaria berberidis CBS 394.84]